MSCRHDVSVPTYYRILDASGHQEGGADMRTDFIQIIVNEVANSVMGDAPELRPLSQGSNRRFLTGREYAT